MSFLTDRIGTTYAPDLYAVGREKIREYAWAVGETNPLHLDLAAARSAGHADLVAPPMFAVVYVGRAIIPALFDPELQINLSMLVHGKQRFSWGPLVIAGDEITTTVSVKDVRSGPELTSYVYESTSVNQRGETVCLSEWTNIMRCA